MRENKGKMRMCNDRKKACMKGDKKSAPKKAKKRKKVSGIECTKKYMDCRGKRKGSRKVCRAEKKRCLSGELEEEVVEVKKKEKVRKKKKKKGMKRKKGKKRAANRSPKNASCWTINMMMENCRGHVPNKCKTLSDAFTVEDNCSQCLHDYRMKMKLQDPMILQHRHRVKKCQKHKKNTEGLAACLKTVKNKNERFATKSYYEAQLKNDEIVSEAKDSGIPNCGNFTRPY